MKKPASFCRFLYSVMDQTVKRKEEHISLKRTIAGRLNEVKQIQHLWHMSKMKTERVLSYDQFKHNLSPSTCWTDCILHDSYMTMIGQCGIIAMQKWNICAKQYEKHPKTKDREKKKMQK